MAGWNSWKPQRLLLKFPGGQQWQQTDEEAWSFARTQVIDLSSAGARQVDIARLMAPPMDPATLRKHFRDELTLGMQRQIAQVAATAFRLASGGQDPAMTRWWLACRAGPGFGRYGAASKHLLVEVQSIPGDDRL